MPVLAPLKPFFDRMISPSPRQDTVPVAEARAAMHAMIEQSFGSLSAQHAPLPSERDYRVAVNDGEIAVRVYTPANITLPAPCHFYIHGGGFWLGTLEQADSICRATAADAGCIVVSVDYRLAPEHKFPSPAEDCYAALLWLAKKAKDLNVDAARISVGGGSAGGNLAAVVALMARDRGGPPLILQVLEFPVIDFTNVEPLNLPSEGLVVPSGKAQYRAHYLGDLKDATNPYASPIFASSLRGLPPALVMCVEYDPLRQEGEAYVKRLKDAGVPVEYRCWEGQFHGSTTMAALIPQEAAAYHAQLVRALRKAYGTLTN